MRTGYFAHTTLIDRRTELLCWRPAEEAGDGSAEKNRHHFPAAAAGTATDTGASVG